MKVVPSTFSIRPSSVWGLLVRRNVGSSTIDRFRNYYYIAASFVNEVPVISDKERIEINVSVSRFFNGVITTFDEFDSIITITETDQFGNVIQNKLLTTPINITVTEGNSVKLIAAQETTFDNIVMEFEGWRFVDNGALAKTIPEFEFKKISTGDLDLVVSYVDPENPGQPQTDFDNKNVPPKGGRKP